MSTRTPAGHRAHRAPIKEVKRYGRGIAYNRNRVCNCERELYTCPFTFAYNRDVRVKLARACTRPLARSINLAVPSIGGRQIRIAVLDEAVDFRAR